MPRSGIALTVQTRSRKRRSNTLCSTLGGPCATSASEKTKSKFYGDKSVLPLRGGSWHNSAGAGVFALNFNESRANSWDNVGFRAASPPQPDARSSRALRQRRGIKGFAPLPKDKLGIARRFLCAAAIGTMFPGPACSRSIWIARARTAITMLVSAPLYPPSQMHKAHGPCVSAEGIKGLAPGLFLQDRQK